MNEKLTLQDLVDLLANSAGLTKKEADAFLREFLSVVSDSIFSGEQVKIKDFGTFKLTSVKSRESVNVNTGEKIEIPSHHKLSFIPDKVLKLLLNKPFEQFETTLLEDSVSFDSIEESDEPVESLEDEDTGIDELDVVEEIVEDTVDLQAELTKNDEAKEDEKEVPVSVEEEDARPFLSNEEEKPSSDDRLTYVYTYITEPEELEGDNNITIVVPNEQIVVESSQREKSPTVDLIQDDEEETGVEVPLNINKVQEKIDQLKEAIDALAKVNWEDESSEKQGEEAETLNDKENVEIQPDYLGVVDGIDNDGVERVTVHSTEDSENEVVLSSHDDEGSYDGGAGEISRKSLDEDLLKTLVAENTPTETELDDLENVSDRETDVEDEDDNFDYYNYQQDTAWSKLKRRIPLVIFLLAVIAFGGYHFFKLFEQKNDYQNYNTYRSLSDVDTLPNLNETNEEQASLLSEEGELVIPEGVDLSTSSQEVDSLSDKITSDKPLEGDSLQNVTGGVTISKNLHIEVLRKGAYLRSKQLGFSHEGVDGQIIVNKSKTHFPLIEVVKPGATLKQIAKLHYGNANFWVYIYEENRSDMKSIDALSVGQKLTVPDLKKYNTSVDDSEADKKAKALEGKIYSSMGRS